MSSKLTKNPELNLFYLLLRAQRWIARGVEGRIEEARGLPELSTSQLFLIASLDAEGTSLSELARRTGTSRQAVHQASKELVRLGLVELVDDPHDRRVRRARLTTRGRRIDRAVVETVHALEHELARRVGRARVAAMREALEADWDD